MARPSSPLAPTISPREATVSGIWDKLMKRRFIWVRGTPASGKSVLSRLLEVHAHQILPSATVRRLDSWNNNGRRLWREFLEKRRASAAPAIWIIDDARGTYNDLYFWDVYKNIEAYPEVYIIGFDAFTSAMGIIRPYGTPSPVIFEAEQIVTLRPVDHDDGTSAIGLLLTKEEFADMVQRRYADAGGHRFDDSFLNKLFEISRGHVGAVECILAIAEGSTPYRELKGSPKRFGWDTFSAAFPPAALAEAIENSDSALCKGLPTEDALDDENISKALTLVAQKAVVIDDKLKGVVSKGLEKCMRRGWLHSDMAGEKVAYFCPSPLYLWFVRQKLSMREKEPKDNFLEVVREY